MEESCCTLFMKLTFLYGKMLSILSLGNLIGLWVWNDAAFLHAINLYIYSFFQILLKQGRKKLIESFTSSWRIKRWNVNLTLYLIGPFHSSELNAFSITLNNISGHWKPISHLWSKETRHIHWNRRFKKAYFISDVDSQGSPGQSFRVIVYSLRDETVLFSSDLRVISNFPSQYPWYQAVFKSQINLKNANSRRSSGAEIKRIKQNISVLWL